ncbi:tRNA uracil 4-sulfurtransferase ThiI [Halalkalibacter akibai]|uniref:Probable tRNA sulfurtransferase n=1 Tax=Halalkalibacter akibai (strain ATCC 43226 / DSM 21942 / CIP 109018 / JCM 9157 / 1139) TaxID=1236973 RepID=W4QR77_HALA3|nr:tRNA uracil 4-sulfurtransferase ThiI [Halalkalibacter akibai]GAE34153.1 tRNA S(4)U 4-thiouridine synthase [Halalkalibacter akibai JCM 9157]
MIYDHILVRFGELALKGKNRSVFEKHLLENIKMSLKPLANLKLSRTFGRILIELNGEDHEPVVEKLQHIFGIHSFSLAFKVNNDIDSMKHGALTVLKENENVNTFKITAKRAYKPFPLDTMELNREIGGYVLANTSGISVDVHNPDLNIHVEVRETATYITSASYKGAGGLPVGTSGKVMMLLSGGIDSPVAGYLTLKRGAKIEAVHFHSPPYTNERAKQKVIDLAQSLVKFGNSVVLHLVPFTDLQKHIHSEIPSNMQMTIMRRMMLRISEKIATDRGILALGTGESLGQVASQTLHSMNTINEVTNLPIIRPLVTMDKLEVISIAQKIGTYETSILPFEDCCTIFLPPDSKTRPKREQANKFEQFIEMDKYIDDAVARTEKMVLTNTTRVKQEVEDLF